MLVEQSADAGDGKIAHALRPELPEPGILVSCPPALVLIPRSRFEDEASRTRPRTHRDGSAKEARACGVTLGRSPRRGTVSDGFDVLFHDQTHIMRATFAASIVCNPSGAPR